jgi:hypothetical protein
VSGLNTSANSSTRDRVRFCVNVWGRGRVLFGLGLWLGLGLGLELGLRLRLKLGLGAGFVG